MPASAGASGSLSIATMKAARSSFSAGSSAATAFSRCLAAAQRAFDRRRGGGVVARRGRRRPPSPAPPSRSSPDSSAARSAAMRLGQRRQVGDGDGVLARGGAQREQALLGALQLARVEIGRGQRPGQPLLGLLQRDERLVEGGDGIVEQAAGLRRLALQPAHEAGQHRHRRGAAGDRLVRLGDVAGDLLGPHHLLARGRRARPPRPAFGASAVSSSTAARR